MKVFEELKNRARLLRAELHALWLANCDPRTPAAARWLTVCVVVYALSPIDLIPDFIPVIGYLDDLILLPLGIAFALRMIPEDVMIECRELTRQEPFHFPEKWRKAAAITVILIWLLTLGLVWGLLFHDTLVF